MSDDRDFSEECASGCREAERDAEWQSRLDAVTAERDRLAAIITAESERIAGGQLVALRGRAVKAEAERDRLRRAIWEFTAGTDEQQFPHIYARPLYCGWLAKWGERTLEGWQPTPAKEPTP